MKTLAIVQARMSSTRLPKKVMREIGGMPMIEVLLRRLSLSRRIDRIIVATPDAAADEPLGDLVKRLGYRVYAGSENNVLDRFYRAACEEKARAVVRITADCPLVDPQMIDEIIELFESRKVDYASNTEPPSYPDGLDAEVFTFEALERAWTEATSARDTEHVTPYLRESGKFSTANIVHSSDLSRERWTVDEPEDLEVANNILRYFAPRLDFGWLEVVELSEAHPNLFQANRHLSGVDGAHVGTGQKLWKRAKRVIPGGNMLLSKRAEMFLPDRWPAYFSKAKGCRVWDLDGREYIDTGHMGIGTNILGYGHAEVDEAVLATVRAGNMSTFNCPEEVYLAERLVELHPWAEMARFARSGGEANAIAIRIARAAAGRDKVAFCGYHGWHDWYLSANLADDRNLDGHLLPGLEPKGVPRSLRATVLPFDYNDFAALEALVAGGDVGVIKMEVARNQEPDVGFLGRIRELATRNRIVLVFDECTSGFRETFGGLHKKYGIAPDIAVFGKTLGNGYAITAVIGRREVMEAAQSTFISSTFWTERIGPTAALKSLEVMERMKSWESVSRMGRDIAARWRSLAGKHGLDVEVSGLAAIPEFHVRSNDWLAYKTLITQEMLKSGFLAGGLIYVCTEHTGEIVDQYFERLDPVFGLIRECEDGRDVGGLLEGPVCHGGFKRLT